MISTLGLVRGSSKKQRIAKKTLKANKAIANNLAYASKLAEQANRQQERPQEPNYPNALLDQLERLAVLKGKGVLTQEELEAEKKRILSSLRER